MGKYKWLGEPPLGRGVYYYEGEDYFPGDIMPDGVEKETIKSLLAKGKIEKVSEVKTQVGPLFDVEGLKPQHATILTESGYKTPESVVEAGEDTLCKLSGIGAPTAKSIVEACSKAGK